MTSIIGIKELLQELALLNGEILKIDENLTELNKDIIEKLQQINELKFQKETSEELLKELLKKRKDLIKFIEKRYPI
jgi:septal ring factor EnvC (AmiA/AmiB activator)